MNQQCWGQYPILFHPKMGYSGKELQLREKLKLKNRLLYQIFLSKVKIDISKVVIYRHCFSLFKCNDPSLINVRLRLANLSREYCLDAFLQSVPAFIIVANSS